MGTDGGGTAPRPDDPPKFFISYNTANEDWAVWIDWVLRKKGYGTIVQAYDFAGGNVMDNIERGLQGAGKIIAVWSHKYGKEGFGKREWQSGAAGDPGGSNDRVIPVRVEDVVLPGTLKNTVWVDLFGKKREQAKEALIRRVGGSGRPLAEPPFPGEEPTFPGTAGPTGFSDANTPFNPDPVKMVNATPVRQAAAEATKQRIQVIGWKGIEVDHLYVELKNHTLAFLTTEMSFETLLPTLEYYAHDSNKKLKFDVVYMDYEFASRYDHLQLITDLRSDSGVSGFLNKLNDRDRIAPAIRSLMFPGYKDGNKPILCVPIQFGFNEVLLNTKGELSKDLHAKANDPDAVWSHGDFDLMKLLEDGKTKVAIWHWYLPSLLQFLLSAESRLSKENTDVSAILGHLSKNDPESLRKSNAFESHMNTLCESLMKPGCSERVEVFRSMADIRNALRPKGGFGAGVVLGLGSSVLVGSKPSDEFEHVRAIVPKEGVLAWINCAAAVPKNDITSATVLINHWLAYDTQMTMVGKPGGYFGLPANERALTEVLTMPEWRKMHAVRTFQSLCQPQQINPAHQNPPPPLFRKGMVAHRVLPQRLWGRWVHLWENFVKATYE